MFFHCRNKKGRLLGVLRRSSYIRYNCTTWFSVVPFRCVCEEADDEMNVLDLRDKVFAAI